MTGRPSAAALDVGLADDLERVLGDEPFGLPCNTLAVRLARRKADVLAALDADPRFVRRGRTRGTRWRLAAYDRLPDPREQMGTNLPGECD